MTWSLRMFVRFMTVRLDGRTGTTLTLRVYGRVRRNIDRHVRRNALLLHVHPMHRKNAGLGNAERRPVDQGGAVGADHKTAGWLPNELAQSQGAKSAREDFGIAVRLVVDEQHDRL